MKLALQEKLREGRLAFRRTLRRIRERIWSLPYLKSYYLARCRDEAFKTIAVRHAEENELYRVQLAHGIKLLESKQYDKAFPVLLRVRNAAPDKTLCDEGHRYWLLARKGLGK